MADDPQTIKDARTAAVKAAMEKKKKDSEKAKAGLASAGERGKVKVPVTAPPLVTGTGKE